MTEDILTEVLNILEWKYKTADVESQFDRIYNDGRVAAIADVRDLIKKYSNL